MNKAYYRFHMRTDGKMVYAGKVWTTEIDVRTSLIKKLPNRRFDIDRVNRHVTIY